MSKTPLLQRQFQYTAQEPGSDCTEKRSLSRKGFLLRSYSVKVRLESRKIRSGE